MTIRLFVGCAPDGDDAESLAVLEYSLRKHASVGVDITWMKLSRDPASPFHGWNTKRWSTPFSGFRWAVPQLAGWQGRAAYCDCDTIWLADINELVGQEMGPGKSVLAKGGREHGWRFCVAVFDCDKMHDLIPPISTLAPDENSHAKMISFFRQFAGVQPFVDNWNCLDGENLPLTDPSIKVLHYSDEATQPHLPYARARLGRGGRVHWFERTGGKVREHARRDVISLFDDYLDQARRDGYVPEKYEVPADKCYGEYALRAHVGYRGNTYAR